MQGGGGLRRIELGEARHGAVRRQALDLDPSLPQEVEYVRVRPHPLIRTGPDDQPPGELAGHVLQVDPRELVALASPPVLDHAVREHDHVARELPVVNQDVTEAISADRAHGTSQA